MQSAAHLPGTRTDMHTLGSFAVASAWQFSGPRIESTCLGRAIYAVTCGMYSHSSSASSKSAWNTPYAKSQFRLA